MTKEEPPEEISAGRFRFDPHILDHFSVAMYKEPKKAISELVANSFDADAKEVDVQIPPDWTAPDAEIVIEDDGEGMLPEEIRGKFLLLGYNKRNDVTTTRAGRKPLGSKGLGKLAGLGLAEAMYYQTTKGGRTSRFTICRKDLDSGTKSLDEFEIEIATQKLGLSHGTTVRLRPIHKDVEPVSVQDVSKYLTLEFAKKRNFRITVNGTSVEGEELAGERYTIQEKIPGYDVVKGWYKILDSPAANPGFSVRVRGRIVKPRSTFRLGPSASKAINYAYIVGDVQADFLDSDTPGSKLDEFTIATDREGFNEASPAYRAFESWAVEKLKSIAKEVQLIRSARVQKKFRRSPAIKKALDKLPERVREQVLLFSARLIHELPWENEEVAVELLKSLVESRVMDEVMLVLKELLRADAKDVKGFARLLAQYGLVDLWRTSEYVSNRLEAIDQFAKLILNEDALELADIHPVVEENLWLLSDDYVMLSSNEEIRTHIIRDLGLENTPPEKERPDLICRSYKKHLVVIELKRGSYKLESKNFTQICQYIDILKKYYPTSRMETFLIGGSCVPGPGSSYSGVPVTMTTYSEVLEEVRDRYQAFIKILRKKKNA